MSPIKGSGLVWCAVVGCRRQHVARGYCSLHYQRMRLRGTTEPLRVTLEERFWRKVNRTGGPDACWFWTGARMPKGYGYLHIGSLTDGTRRNALAHRLSYELTNGDVPTGLHVCHRCDTPPCVNPAHLFLGTGIDNHADKVRKGRQASGERQGSARLTAAAVREVREMAQAGVLQKVIAAQFGLHQSHVSRLVLRKQWRHVE